MPRESRAARRERLGKVLDRLHAEYPDSRCSLDHQNPLQLLVATVLSAQTTDASVNRVTPALFARFRTAQDYASASQEEMEEYLKTLNFFRNKSRSLIGLGQALAENFGGEVPRSIPELTSLPGVGRKTANVVLGVGFNIAEGVVVDTHVKRLSARLGVTKEEDPEKIEQDLIPLLPPERRVIFTHLMIDHGRAVCTARRAFCERCVVADLCPTAPAAYRVVQPPARTAAPPAPSADATLAVGPDALDPSAPLPDDAFAVSTPGGARQGELLVSPAFGELDGRAPRVQQALQLRVIGRDGLNVKNAAVSVTIDPPAVAPAVMVTNAPAGVPLKWSRGTLRVKTGKDGSAALVVGLDPAHLSALPHEGIFSLAFTTSAGDGELRVTMPFRVTAIPAPAEPQPA
ncbi:MAG TPA: endonuclease III [Longimicrobium sp.]|nr:endonuclease III [Longimicrobium sp.]